MADGDLLGAVHRAAATGGGGVYLGAGHGGPVWAGREQATLVLGPPRSGKTTALVIPTVLGATGSVVSTSTKPDVLAATAATRQGVGPCLLYDPSGTVVPPPGVQPVRWSPVAGSARWDDAMLMAASLVSATRPAPGRSVLDGASDHWTERAATLLAPLLHAAALDHAPMRRVLAWVEGRDVAPALDVLVGAGAAVAASSLQNIAMTEPRELSAIWSTTSGVLAAYRSEAALHSTVAPDFDPVAFCTERATLYVCATGRRQALAAPLVVGLLTDIRAGAYELAARRGTARDPVLLVLDEVANIAPIPDLPDMVSEGAGQGLLTMACLQDLSQARARWGAKAAGLLSLFGTTVVLPGIADVPTLQAISALAGEEQVPTRSVSVPVTSTVHPARAVLERVVLGRWAPTRPVPSASVTHATVHRPRLPVDVIGRGEAGKALVIGSRNQMAWVGLTPWFAYEPWRTLVRGELGRDHAAGTGRSHLRSDHPAHELATGRLADRRSGHEQLSHERPTHERPAHRAPAGRSGREPPRPGGGSRQEGRGIAR